MEFSEIKKKIVTICRSEPSIAAAYIFGSYGKGTQKAGSDIDVAVLLHEQKAEVFGLLDFISTVEKKLGRQVDVVVLNNANELLKYEVRRYGVLVFERSRVYRKKFDIKSRKFFEDFQYLHNRYVRKVIYGEQNGQSDYS